MRFAGKIKSSLRNAFAFMLSVQAPKGLLGVSWGDDAVNAAACLGLSCEVWSPWEGGQGYEVCFDTSHPVDVFCRKAYVRLLSRQHRLEGISLRFMQCGATTKELREAVRRKFKLKAGDGALYHVFCGGAVVHLEYNSGDDSCELTVTGAQFGKAFANYQLEQGFKSFSSGLRPR